MNEYKFCELSLHNENKLNVNTVKGDTATLQTLLNTTNKWVLFRNETLRLFNFFSLRPHWHCICRK